MDPKSTDMDNMAHSVEIRLKAIEGSHIAAQYDPASTHGIISTDEWPSTIESRLNALEESVRLNTAMISNYRTIAHNFRNQLFYEPLRKTVPGDGYEKAVLVTPGYTPQIRASGFQPAPIGAIPPNFVVNIGGYSTRDIAQLIIFYNEDFDIVASDDEVTRRTKLCQFLTYL